ncbi:MAG: alcohol dehydrogenase catalytic domain-containing protein, partial [Candidatus Theseobacter exili]|nr:alcohol dehydrogenase catalytic domain-containing protein [Candidatus Theseobacter exili]
MKALITNGKGDIELWNVSVPSIGEYDCLVKIKSCLFCNTTDRHIVENSFDFGLTYPAILGHESIGVVVETGKKVSNFAVGDLVARPYAIYPDANTKEGLYSAWGGFAEYGMIRDYKAMLADKEIKEEDVPSFFLYMQKIPDGINWRKAMMISCQKEIFSSAALIDTTGKTILISGAGVTGCLFATFLKLRGAAKVVIAARRPEQREFVRKNTSADQALSFNELNEQFDCIVDTSGSLDLLKILSSKYLLPDGNICSYAIYSNMEDEFFSQNIARFKR